MKTLHIAECFIAIQNIERRKREANITPPHVLRVTDLFKELKQYPEHEIDMVLRELLNMKRIEAGRTINDTWIKTK